MKKKRKDIVVKRAELRATVDKTRSTAQKLIFGGHKNAGDSFQKKK